MTINFKMKPDAVYFVPLGGCGYFGMNMSLYGYNGKWIMVDFGMGFADDTMPGVDVLLPDLDFPASLGDDLLGIVITHGHEDHIGAIQYMWPRIKKPIYATKFTMERIKQAVSEQPWGDKTMLQEVPLGGEINLDPFNIGFVNMTHSIPETSALAIKIPEVGTVLHSSDWKLDLNPVEGDITDKLALVDIGDEGVLALVGDSTNAMVPGRTGSEITVQKNLTELFGEFKTQIAITCFATNVARLRSIYNAAQVNGRQVCLVGRSLKKVDEIARNTGYLEGVVPFISEDEALDLKSNKVVYICTGSQGEPRAALSRIAAGEHPRVTFGENTVVIFSSRSIPGNEKAIERVKNRLYTSGVNVIDSSEISVHVSGHCYREEIKDLYEWTRPEILIPVHGEQMMLEKHADLAEECGIEEVFIPYNGNVIEISKNGTAENIAEVHTGILAMEGNRIVAVDHEAISMRKRIMYNGSAIVTIVIDDSGKLIAEPKVTALGLLDENCDLDAEYIDDVIKEIKITMKKLPKSIRDNDEAMAEKIRIATRRFFNARFNRKPQTRVHLVRI